MVPVDECKHWELQFNSGDYYITCCCCGATWMRKGIGKPEYGKDADGREIGADPTASNIGVGADLSGKRRIALAR